MLATEFKVKDLGLMHCYMGLEVREKHGEIYIGQGKYIIKILQRFIMMDFEPMTTP